MREMRVELEMTIGKMMLRAAFTHLVDDEADVHELGRQDGEALLEYAAGLASGAPA